MKPIKSITYYSTDECIVLYTDNTIQAFSSPEDIARIQRHINRQTGRKCWEINLRSIFNSGRITSITTTVA